MENRRRRRSKGSWSYAATLKFVMSILLKEKCGSVPHLCLAKSGLLSHASDPTHKKGKSVAEVWGIRNREALVSVIGCALEFEISKVRGRKWLNHYSEKEPYYSALAVNLLKIENYTGFQQYNHYI